MRESFGARLRQRRERQKIALITIADETKINLSLLEALERDDLSHWPVGIFRRAFVRAYAHAIGLEPDVVVREFLTVHPDPIEDSAGEANGDDRAAGAPTRLRHLVGSALGSFSRFRTERVHARPAVVASPLAVNGMTPSVPASFEPDVLAAARLCTELGRVDQTSAVGPLLAEVAGSVDAIGLIVWVWDPLTTELKPDLTYGYSDKILAQLPTVKRDADNATAAAFRSAEACVVNGTARANGALAVPLMAPSGCLGVLAVELRSSAARTEMVHALVTMFAAQLARCIGAGRPAEVPERRLA
jgi:hypothetical protein